MRSRLLRALLVSAALVAVGLAGCTSTPPQRMPRTAVGRFILRLRYQPPPMPTPDAWDRACVESLAANRDLLAEAVVDQLTGVQPDPQGGDDFDLLREAMDEAGVSGGSGLSAQTSINVTRDVWVKAVGWCSGHGGTDIFVQSAAGDVWHVAASDLRDDVSTIWLDGMWLLTQRTRGLTQTVRLWVVEYENGGWMTTYEAEHSGLALDGVYHPPEMEFFEEGGVHHMRLEYERESGTQVRRVYQLQPGGYVLVEDGEVEEAN